LVVAGAPPVTLIRPADDDLAAAVARLETTGTPKKAAIADVARAYGLPKRELYDIVVRARSS
jgi:16S rRNA (cytidine1402-2'-O)-methyltransferase